MAKILRFALVLDSESQPQIGRVHLDGSITFRGHRYPNFGDVPPECKGLRPDVETYRQWRALFGPIDPRRRRL